MSSSRLEPPHAPPPHLFEDAEEPVRPASFECDACGESFEGPPGGSGLFLWTRGDEVRYEEPPLCEACAAEITIGALLSWDVEDEEEG